MEFIISMNIKDITIPLIIHYYLLRAFRTHTNLSTLNHNVRFLPCQAPGRWHNAIRVRAKPCVHRFNYSRTLPQRSSPSGLDIVSREYNDDSSHLTLININNMKFQLIV